VPAGDSDGAGGDEAQPKRASPWRAVVLSLFGAGVFGALLTSYILKSARITDAPTLLATADAAGPSDDALARAQRVADAFVAALRAGDVAGAYAQMARPYRESATLGAFAAAWRTPLLASPRAVKLSRTTERAAQIDGHFVRGATFTASGVLVGAAGALDASFTFLREGDEARVLAVFVGGVPIVQGLGPNAPSR
jgi:hypothetical protein